MGRTSSVTGYPMTCDRCSDRWIHKNLALGPKVNSPEFQCRFLDPPTCHGTPLPGSSPSSWALTYSTGLDDGEGTRKGVYDMSHTRSPTSAIRPLGPACGRG